MTHIKRYSEMIQLESFEDRYEYLRLGGGVGATTFGYDRHINQAFYTSHQWKEVRRYVVLRDNGCDLGLYGHEIPAAPMVHHMNPMTVDDIVNGEQWILDPQYLITVRHSTHNAIHYGDAGLLITAPIERQPHDTTPWRR